MMSFEEQQMPDLRKLKPGTPAYKKAEAELIKAISDSEMEDDDFDRMMRKAHQARKKKR